MKLNEIQQEQITFLTSEKDIHARITYDDITFKSNYTIIDGMVYTSGEVTFNGTHEAHLPFRFGSAGSFIVCNCKNLVSLEGSPEELRGKATFLRLPNLRSLEGGPKTASSYTVEDCKKIKDLKGIATGITGTLALSGTSLQNLDDLPRYDVVELVWIRDNKKLTSIKNLPTRITRDLNLHSGNDSLVSLEGISDSLKYCYHIDFFPAQIMSHGLGLILIEQNWSNFSMGTAGDNKEGWQIIEKYLNKPDDIFACQAELIEAGFDDLAQL